MTTTTDRGAVAPEVHEFLTAVRGHLADLDPDEQREILDGLEADLTDLVAERGRGALGDPAAYARELRQAAGLDVDVPSGRSSIALSTRVHAVLDASHHWWDRTVAAFPGDLAGFAHAIQPLWWVARGWLAVELVDERFGRGTHAGDLTVVPQLRGYGWMLLLVAVVASVQVGRGRLWPGGSGRGAFARTTLLGLNLLALAVAPLLLQQVDDHSSAVYSRGFNRGVDTGYANGQEEMRGSGTDKAGLYLDGTWVSNIYPYDAKGRPLVGVQLFNQVGKPINVITQPEYAQPTIDDQGNETDANGNPVDPSVPPQPRVYYPWSNGATQLLNVFPIPSRVQPGEEPSASAFAEKDPPTIGAFPLASVPRVSLPGIKPGVLPASR